MLKKYEVGNLRTGMDFIPSPQTTDTEFFLILSVITNGSGNVSKINKYKVILSILESSLFSHRKTALIQNHKFFSYRKYRCNYTLLDSLISFISELCS